MGKTTNQIIIDVHDDPNNAIRVNQVAGTGGATQYTEGDTDSSITGTAILWEDSSDTLRAVSTTKPLPIQGTVALDSASLVALEDINVTVTVAPEIEIKNDSGNPIPVSGTVDTELTTADLDTGAGTDTRAVVGLVGSASGGGQLIPGSSTDGLLVNLGSNNDVTVTGSVTANAGTNLNTSLLALESGGNLAGAATSLAVIDDWDETDRAKVNLIVGEAGVQGGSGTVSTNTQRVVLATDVALPAGTNAIGKLSSNDGVDIGDVTINNASGGSAVNIQDGGNSITVDGTIAVTQSGTWTVQPGNTANTTPWLVSTKTDLSPASPTAASVGTSSAQAVAANASRKGLVLTNTSVNTISFGIGATAVLNSGITLYPGGHWQMDETTFDTGAINAIASAASSGLSIQEFS